MNYNSEQYGFELIKGKNHSLKPSKKRKISSKNKSDQKEIKSDKGIEFSKKIIEALKSKVKDHNAKNNKKINLSQLKKVYRRGADSFSCSNNKNKLRGQCAMARVNMFLRMVGGELVKDSFKANSDIARASANDYIIEASFEPNDGDFNKADEDIKTHNLNDFDFLSADELYLDDEDDGFIFTFEV